MNANRSVRNRSRDVDVAGDSVLVAERSSERPTSPIDGSRAPSPGKAVDFNFLASLPAYPTYTPPPGPPFNCATLQIWHQHRKDCRKEVDKAKIWAQELDVWYESKKHFCVEFQACFGCRNKFVEERVRDLEADWKEDRQRRMERVKELEEDQRWLEDLIERRGFQRRFRGG